MATLYVYDLYLSEVTYSLRATEEQVHWAAPWVALSISKAFSSICGPLGSTIQVNFTLQARWTICANLQTQTYLFLRNYPEYADMRDPCTRCMFKQSVQLVHCKSLVQSVQTCKLYNRHICGRRCTHSQAYAGQWALRQPVLFEYGHRLRKAPPL